MNKLKGLVGFKVKVILRSNNPESGKPTFLCDIPTMYLTISSGYQNSKVSKI